MMSSPQRFDLNGAMADSFIERRVEHRNFAVNDGKSLTKPKIQCLKNNG